MTTRTVLIVVDLITILLVPGSLYVVHQTEQAIITQFV